MQKTHEKKIPIAKPIMGIEEKKAVLAVLSSGMLSQGIWVEEFEKKFAKYIGTKYAITTSNGTCALHLALLALGIGKGDEVITTPFTFIASANSVLYTGAKPIFVDIDEKTFNMNPDLIEERITKKTKAILPVHLYGLPADMNKVMKIAKKHKLFVIEDACQAHGAKIRGKNVGSFGDMSCFSFYPTKNMTTGEGGMVTTNNKALAEKVRLLRDHGMKVRYYHDILGYNFRMTNIAAAIGTEQLKKLPKLNKKRVRNSRFLTSYLSKIKGIKVPFIPKEYKHVFHQYTICITPKYKLSRDKLIEVLEKNGVGYSIYYPVPVHKQKIYRNLGYKDKLPISEKLAKEVLSIPIHASLNQIDLKRIISSIKD